MYGALNNISDDLIEAARIDGAGPVQIAVHIQLPLLRKWIEKETEAIRARFADPQPRMFPVAVTFLVPEKMRKG